MTIKDNYIHDNWGPGGWADTDNANTTWTGNTITDNEGAAIIEEISYNFSITDNYIAGNNIIDGLGNNQFPSPAIYISESGSDRTFGGVPACPEASCSGQPSYPDTVRYQRQHAGRQWRQHLSLAELQPLLLGRFRWRLHAGRRRALRAVHDRFMQSQPARGIGQHRHLQRQEDRLAADGLVEWLPVGDRERQRHPEHDRLQPGGHHGLQSDRLARLRRRRHLQRVRLAARPRPRLGHPHPADVLPEQRTGRTTSITARPPSTRGTRATATTR